MSGKKKQVPTPKSQGSKSPKSNGNHTSTSNGKPAPASPSSSATNGKVSLQAAYNDPTVPAHVREQALKDLELTHVGWLWPLLSLFCMIFVPLAVYWCWICVEFNQGAMLLPKSFTGDAIKHWWMVEIWARIVDKAFPSTRAIAIYSIWLVFQAILFLYGPGPVGKGGICADGRRLSYCFNGQFAFFVTIGCVSVLHYTRIFRLQELYDLFPALLTVCIAVCSLVILSLQLYAWVYGRAYRPSDSIIYNYFMGPMLNPRIGAFDIKYFFELRPGIMHWFFTTIALCLKQYDTYGTISTPMALICFYHLCFVNACYKGEQCVPYTIDIIYEKFGWMLLMLDIVMVPFIFPLQAYYIFKMGPYEHSLPMTILVASMHIFGYWMFDTANSQKDYFREHEKAKTAKEKGEVPEPVIPKGFPTLPWDRLENPKFIQTKRGTKLLVDGWWKYARHMNYTGDLLMSWSWGLTCGVTSYFPFAYTTYLTPLLLHRERRDDRDCHEKYGENWEEYTRRVPYRLFPWIY